MSVDDATRELVAARASGRCEYCLLPEFAEPYDEFHVEHIYALQHGGEDHPDNLAWSYPRCNLFKGTNLASIDPTHGDVVTLFNPRTESWSLHFEVRFGRIVGLTPTGRATVRLLKMNFDRRLQLRRWLIQHGLFKVA